MGQLELIQALGKELMEVIEKYDESMPFATLIGVLDILRAQLILNAIDEGADESLH